jgi:hydroxymethylbilane synthase
VRAIRGNVDTRLRKWRQTGAGGVILAAAGLDRLGDALDRDGLPLHRLSPEQMLPAPGQGILALEALAGSEAAAVCATLAHGPSAEAARAERRIVAAFGGDCTLPLAAWARREGGALRLSALLATPDGTFAARGEGSGDDPETAADACIAALREAGAEEVLARIQSLVAAGPGSK